MLDNTLKKCAFDFNKISSLFPKWRTQGKSTPQSQNTKHIHKAQHTHGYIYGKVNSCTHCGRKRHLAQYCYSRLNFKNDKI